MIITIVMADSGCTNLGHCMCRSAGMIMLSQSFLFKLAVNLWHETFQHMLLCVRASIQSTKCKFCLQPGTAIMTDCANSNGSRGVGRGAPAHIMWLTASGVHVSLWHCVKGACALSLHSVLTLHSALCCVVCDIKSSPLPSGSSEMLNKMCALEERGLQKNRY